VQLKSQISILASRFASASASTARRIFHPRSPATPLEFAPAEIAEPILFLRPLEHDEHRGALVAGGFFQRRLLPPPHLQHTKPTPARPHATPVP